MLPYNTKARVNFTHWSFNVVIIHILKGGMLSRHSACIVGLLSDAVLLSGRQPFVFPGSRSNKLPWERSKNNAVVIFICSPGSFKCERPRLPRRRAPANCQRKFPDCFCLLLRFFSSVAVPAGSAELCDQSGFCFFSFKIFCEWIREMGKTKQEKNECCSEFLCSHIVNLISQRVKVMAPPQFLLLWINFVKNKKQKHYQEGSPY